MIIFEWSLKIWLNRVQWHPCFGYHPSFYYYNSQHCAGGFGVSWENFSLVRIILHNSENFSAIHSRKMVKTEDCRRCWFTGRHDVRPCCGVEAKSINFRVLKCQTLTNVWITCVMPRLSKLKIFLTKNSHLFFLLGWLDLLLSWYLCTVSPRIYVGLFEDTLYLIFKMPNLKDFVIIGRIICKQPTFWFRVGTKLVQWT